MISIIVPVYNVEKYIARCIESLVGQTYQNIEILLIDDGSRDNSLTICKQFSDKYENIRAIHIENHGVSYARNLGIESSKGEYVLFVDSDDYIEKNMIENLLYEQKKRDVDIVLCGYYRENDEKKVMVIPDDLNCSFAEFDKTISYWTFDPIIGSPCNKLFKSQILKEFNLRFCEGMSYGEDFSFCMKYYSHIHKFSTISKALYHYRDTPNSLTKKNAVDADRLWKDQCFACDCLFDFVKKNGISIDLSDGAKQAYSYICSFNFYKRMRAYGILKSVRWLINHSTIKYKDLIKGTDNLSRVGKLNYVFKIVKIICRIIP